MTRFTVDPSLAARLGQLDGPVVLCDESGRTIGYFNPAVSLQEAIRQCPFSDEEIERRRQQQGGRPLSEILADLARL